jgi:hypothetical protein
MIWDETHVDETVPRQSGVLLGFNEPDNTDQANMTVDQAISLWPKLMNSGLRLGSPAMAGNASTSSSWLGQFMAKANGLGYRVDFIAIHYYSANGDVTAFKNYLTAVYNLYQRPIWVTEWALVDWTNTSRYTSAQNAAFAKAALEMLDDLPFVEKHAWFAAEKAGVNTELYDSANALTAVGQVFHDVLSATAPIPPALDTVAPTAVVTSPASGRAFPRRTKLTLTASASDNVGVKQVIFLVDGKQVCADSSAPYSCTWSTPKRSGDHIIRVKAIDAAGNTGYSSDVIIHVN